MKKIQAPLAQNRIESPTFGIALAEKLLCPESDDFTAIYDTYQNAIFRYCLHKSRHQEIGQDLMQETFLRFWLCLERKEQILNARAFLYRIAHNLIVDYSRRKKEASLDQLLETGFEPTVDPWRHTYNELDAEKPLKELDKMPNGYKKVLHRRFILGLPPSAIAHMTGETPNMVSVRIFRGLKQLRLRLPLPQTSHVQ